MEAGVEKSVVAIAHIVSPLYALEHHYLLLADTNKTVEQQVGSGMAACMQQNRRTTCREWRGCMHATKPSNNR